MLSGRSVVKTYRKSASRASRKETIGGLQRTSHISNSEDFGGLHVSENRRTSEDFEIAHLEDFGGL